LAWLPVVDHRQHVVDFRLNSGGQLDRSNLRLFHGSEVGGLSALAGARSSERARLGRGTGQLSDLFLQPDSVEQMRAIAARAAAETPMTEAMLRQIIQAPAELGASGRW